MTGAAAVAAIRASKQRRRVLRLLDQMVDDIGWPSVALDGPWTCTERRLERAIDCYLDDAAYADDRATAAQASRNYDLLRAAQAAAAEVAAGRGAI